MITMIQILSEFKDRPSQIDLFYRMMVNQDVLEMVDYLDDVYGIELSERQVSSLVELSNRESSVEAAFGAFESVFQSA